MFLNLSHHLQSSPLFLFQEGVLKAFHGKWRCTLPSRWNDHTHLLFRVCGSPNQRLSFVAFRRYQSHEWNLMCRFVNHWRFLLWIYCDGSFPLLLQRINGETSSDSQNGTSNSIRGFGIS